MKLRALKTTHCGPAEAGDGYCKSLLNLNSRHLEAKYQYKNRYVFPSWWAMTRQWCRSLSGLATAPSVVIVAQL